MLIFVIHIIEVCINLFGYQNLIKKLSLNKVFYNKRSKIHYYFLKEMLKFFNAFFTALKVLIILQTYW